MNRVTFTFTALCPEQDYDLVVEAKLYAPAPECGDPGGWRVSAWQYAPLWDNRKEPSGTREGFAAAFGNERLDLAELMACDAAILEHEGMKIEGSDRA